MRRLLVCFLALFAVALVGLGVVVVAAHGLAVRGIQAFNEIKATHLTAQSATPAPLGNVHIVKKGDTAISIARSCGVTADELLKYNKIADAKKLQPGQTLKIPPKKG
jgi:LysM repeat protein